MIEAANPFPEWRDLKSRITNYDLVGVTVQNLSKQQLASSGVVDNFLFPVPGGGGTVLLLFFGDPIQIPIGVSRVMRVSALGPRSVCVELSVL